MDKNSFKKRKYGINYFLKLNLVLLSILLLLPIVKQVTS